MKIGRSKFSHIEFKNHLFGSDNTTYDLTILSDILEHVEDDTELLQSVSKRSHLLLFKIPLELCLTQTKFFYWLTNRIKPPKLEYGHQHCNGHLRGYWLWNARKLISKHFEILDESLSDTEYFYGTPIRKLFRKLFGIRMTILMFGGAWFGLARSRHFQKNLSE